MLTKGKREFQIDIYGLDTKQYEYEFAISNDLFGSFDHRVVDNGTGICKVLLRKTETMITLHFAIEAEVELTCDRSLDKYMHTISLEEEIIVKFGDEEYDLSENVFVIRRETPSLFIDAFVYEFISLAIPMKKLHPRFESDEVEPELVYTSAEVKDEEAEETDPRWEALKKLKKNK